MSALSTRLPLVLTMLLALLMVAALGWQGYSGWSQYQQSQHSTGRSAVSEAIAPTEQTPQIPISDIELFGKPGADAVTEQIDTENLPETNLRLVLRGVLAADGDFPGSALIEDASADTEAYLVGDELPGNATLRSVHPNRVIINRSGKLENLYFPELTETAGMDFEADQADQQTVADEAQPPQDSASSMPALTTPAASEQRREEIRRRLEELRERLRSNSN